MRRKEIGVDQCRHAGPDVIAKNSPEINVDAHQCVPVVAASSRSLVGTKVHVEFFVISEKSGSHAIFDMPGVIKEVGLTILFLAMLRGNPIVHSVEKLKRVTKPERNNVGAQSLRVDRCRRCTECQLGRSVVTEKI
jgi:hypothetical protein